MNCVQTDQTLHLVTYISEIKVMSAGLRGDPVEPTYVLKNRSRKQNKGERLRHLEVYIFLLSIRAEVVTQVKDSC